MPTGSAKKLDSLHRCKENPVITVEDVPFRANTVVNGTPVVTDEGL